MRGFVPSAAVVELAVRRDDDRRKGRTRVGRTSMESSRRVVDSPDGALPRRRGRRVSGTTPAAGLRRGLETREERDTALVAYTHRRRGGRGRDRGQPLSRGGYSRSSSAHAGADADDRGRITRIQPRSGVSNVGQQDPRHAHEIDERGSPRAMQSADPGDPAGPRRPAHDAGDLGCHTRSG